MPSPELTTFIAGLPKAELHVHHVGSASLATVAKLAQRYEGTTRVPAAAYCDAVEDARIAAERDFGIVLRWCFDVNGGDGVSAADRTLDVALGQQPTGLISFGLGGAEAGVRVTINSDDPPMFGTSLNLEYGVACDLLDWTRRALPGWRANR